MDGAEARGELLRLIEEDALHPSQLLLFTEVASLLELPTRCTERLFAIARDPACPFSARQFAVVGLTVAPPTEEARRMFESLEPELLTAASEMPVISLMTGIQVNPKAAADVTNMLLTAPADVREHLLRKLCGIRRRIGTPAALAYADALAHPGLRALYPVMLEALIEEGGSEASSLLEALRDRATDDDARRGFQMALLRAGTRRLERPADLLAGKTRLFVSNCDGQGAFFLLGRFVVSPTSTTTASCCIRAAREIRDAFVFPSQSEAEFDEMVVRMQRSGQVALAEVSPAEGAALFKEGLRRTEALGCRLPETARPVLDLYERLEAAPIPDPVAVAGVSEEAFTALLERSYYNSWFFDAGDIVGSGIPRPTNDRQRWIRQTARRIRETPLRDRALAMLLHMARWHRWNKEAEVSALLMAARAEVAREFETSIAARCLLERSLGVLEGGRKSSGGEDDLAWETGEGGLRAMLRRAFFSHLKRPRGRHVAELDFAEAAYVHLYAGFACLPAEKRPQEDDLLALSHTVAKTFVHAIANQLELSTVLSKLERHLRKHTLLTRPEIGELLSQVTNGMARFVESHCADCAVRCLDHPRKGMADAFFSPFVPGVE